MTAAYLFVEQLVPPLVLASTLILALGAMLIVASARPAARQRIGELSVCAVLAWLALAILPIRPSLNGTSWRELLATTSAAESASTATSSAATMQSNDVHNRASSLSNGSVANLDPPQAAANQYPPRNVSPLQQVVAIDQLQAPLQVTDNRRAALPPPVFAPLPSVWLAWFTRLYLVGAVLLTLVLLVGKLLLARVVSAASLPPEWLLQTYAALPNTRKARLVVSHRGMPFSCGLVQPTIVLPDQLCTADSTRRLKDVLLHEQAHIERRDAIGHAVLNLALPLLYFHPLYWLLRRKTLFSRELVADSWASQRSDRVHYVESLTQLVRGRRSGLFEPIGVMGMSRFRSSFCRRMNELINRTEPIATVNNKMWKIAATVLTTSLTIGCWLIVGGPTRADDQGSDMAVVEIEADEPAQNEKVKPAPKSTTPLQSVGSAIPCWLQPERTVVIAAVDGLIEATVSPGQQVSQGEVVVSFDDAEARAQLAEAEYQCETLQAKISSGTEIQYAKAQLDQRRAELQLAESARAKVRGSVADAQLNILRSQIIQAELAVAEARHNRQLAARQYTAASMQKSLVDKLLDRYQMRAATDGVVVDQRKSNGDYASRGDPICSIQRMDQLIVAASVPLQDYRPELNKVHVRFHRLGQTIESEGTIQFVEPKVSIQGTVYFTAVIKNRRSESGNWLLLPGMAGQLTYLAPPEQVGSEFRGTAAADRLISDSHSAASREADSQRSDGPQSTLMDVIQAEQRGDDVKALEELVKALTRLQQQTQTRFESGTVGGEPHQLAKVKTALAMAQARLAEATGDLAQALVWYKSAQGSAGDLVQANKRSFESGVASLDAVVEGLNQRVEAKFHLRRLEQILEESSGDVVPKDPSP